MNSSKWDRITHGWGRPCAVAVMLAWTSLAIAGHAECAPIGTTVEAFILPDFYGKPHGPDDYRNQCVVLAFLGTECPLAKYYAPRLRDLAAEFERKGVAFLGIDSNVQDSLSEMATFARLHGVSFPFLKDNDNIVADRLGTRRTPEVFLLDRTASFGTGEGSMTNVASSSAPVMPSPIRASGFWLVRSTKCWLTRK